MLQPNPFNRITAKDALIHPYFKDLPEEILNLYKKWSFKCKIYFLSNNSRDHLKIIRVVN